MNFSTQTSHNHDVTTFLLKMFTIDSLNLKGFAFFFLLFSVAALSFAVQCLIAGAYMTLYGVFILPAVFSTFTSFMLLRTADSSYGPLFWYSIRLFILTLLGFLGFSFLNEFLGDYSVEMQQFGYSIANMLLTALTVLLAFEIRVNFYICIAANMIVSNFFYFYFANVFGIIIFSTGVIAAIAYFTLSHVFKWGQSFDDLYESLEKQPLKSTVV
jgi:hypothetical protein